MRDGAGGHAGLGQDATRDRAGGGGPGAAVTIA